MKLLLVGLLFSFGWINLGQTIQLSCYFNASFPILLNVQFYPNITLESCRCLIFNSTVAAFQYNYQQKTCYTMRNMSSLANIRVTPTSLVCWYNRTTTTTAPITTTLAQAPLTYNSSTIGSSYYTSETVTFTNTNSLSSFSATILVSKTLGATYAATYTTFWSGAVSLSYNETADFIQYDYNLNQGITIPTGTWSFTAQLSLTGTNRPTANDTFSIRINSYQTITGHF